MNKELKWGCIQPLTGGAYLGARKAFEKDADWIISYPGLENANEKVLLNYLKKHNKQIPYYTWDKDMFDSPDNDKPLTLLPNDYYNKETDMDKLKEELLHKLKDTDFVTAVPVCAGLSTASCSSSQLRKQRTGQEFVNKNNNMGFISRFVLETVKPKAFMFENGINLSTSAGDAVRDGLNKLAENYGYSVSYVQTDSRLHSNVQLRKRTFVIFWRWYDGKQIGAPTISFYKDTINSIVEFLGQISPDASENTFEDQPGKKDIACSSIYKFFKHKYGNDYKSVILSNMSAIQAVFKNNLYEEFHKFIKERQDDKNLGSPKLNVLERWNDVRNSGKTFFDYTFINPGEEKIPTIYFKTVCQLIHPVLDRGFTKREFIKFMGLPDDLDWPENMDFKNIIGQNVPVDTQRDWCIEIRKVLENWDELRLKTPTNENIVFHNNMKQTITPSENLNKIGFQF